MLENDYTYTREVTLQATCESLFIDPKDIRGTDALTKKLGADSLDLLDIAAKVEQKLSIKLNIANMEDLKDSTVNDLVNWVYRQYTLELSHKEYEKTRDKIIRGEYMISSES